MQDISFVLLGFFTGLSLILALGAQNIFVIEQGLKKQYVFLVCLICSVSDLLLIFFGIFLFEYFRNFFTDEVELVFNILLLAFLVLLPPVAKPVQSSLFIKIFGPSKNCEIFLRCSIGVGKCPSLILLNFLNIIISLMVRS